MEILLLRHGETDTNVKNLTHKRGAKEGLNETGKEQARRLAEVCRNHNVQALYSSPELRAVETVEIIGEELDIQPVVVEDLTERDWGDWEGQPWSEISAKLQSMSLDERYRFVPPSGESWEQMEHRLEQVVHSISTQGITAAVVTHAGVLRALMPALKQEPLETSFTYDFQNASVTIFENQDEGLKSKLENDTSHLVS